MPTGLSHRRVQIAVVSLATGVCCTQNLDLVPASNLWLYAFASFRKMEDNDNPKPNGATWNSVLCMEI
jgi:hypothetical protein